MSEKSATVRTAAQIANACLLAKGDQSMPWCPGGYRSVTKRYAVDPLLTSAGTLFAVVSHFRAVAISMRT
jgi:hypothetical protein